MPTDRRDFDLRTSFLGAFLVRPLAWGRLFATVDGDGVSVRMGLLGRADLPLAAIDRIGTMRWPWWAGAGVRISKNLVAFVPSTGRVVLIGLSERVKVRAPLPWSTIRVAVAVQDIDGFMDEIARRRGGLPRVDEDF